MEGLLYERPLHSPWCVDLVLLLCSCWQVGQEL